MGASTWQPSKRGPHLLLLFLLAASCTSEAAPTPVPSPTQGPDVVVATASPTLELTAEPGPSATPTPNLPIQFVPWPEQGNLLLPADIEVTFEASLADLPPGGYFLRWEERDTRWQTIEVVSFPQREVSALVSGSGVDFFYGMQPSNFAGSTYISPVSEPRHELDVFELRGQRSWRLGPMCDVGLGGLSPSGKYFLSACDPSCPACANDFTPGVPADFKVFEVISVTDGTGFRVAFPSKGGRDLPWLSWLGEEEVIASRVWIDERFYVCLINVEERTARCPYYFEDGYGVWDDVVTGEHVPLILPPGSGAMQGLIMPRDCLTRGECEGIIDMGEIPGPLYLSPSGERLVLINSGPLHEDNVVAFLEPPGWGLDRLTQLNDSYGLDAWCPDESCVLLEGPGFPRPSYRLDPDGSLTFYPYDNIIGSFTIP
ncbi:MAG: hypothetical protein A2W26_10440 [Acidobacteria bacterium RBG_16_64_8]|nr:MAG: hypothetical protein A2W26_10440 [Acidobacteria bacterium RBG_16_64_8]